MSHQAYLVKKRKQKDSLDELQSIASILQQEPLTDDNRMKLLNQKLIAPEDYELYKTKTNLFIEASENYWTLSQTLRDIEVNDLMAVRTSLKIFCETNNNWELNSYKSR